MQLLPLCPRSIEDKKDVCGSCPLGQPMARRAGVDGGEPVGTEAPAAGFARESLEGDGRRGSGGCQCGDELLAGPRFVLASILVFLLPLAVLTATVAWLTPRIGELRAGAVGWLAAVISVLPSGWQLRVRAKRFSADGGEHAVVSVGAGQKERPR